MLSHLSIMKLYYPYFMDLKHMILEFYKIIKKKQYNFSFPSKSEIYFYVNFEFSGKKFDIYNTFKSI